MLTKYLQRRIEQKGEAYGVVDLASLARNPQLLQRSLEKISNSGIPIRSTETSDYSLPLNLSTVRRARKSSLPLFYFNGRVYSHCTKTVGDKLISLNIKPKSIPSIKRVVSLI